MAKPSDGEEVQLTTTEATFDETPSQVCVTLPPQAEATSGVVWVGAEYGDGVVVQSKRVPVDDWPLYGRQCTGACTYNNMFL